MLYETLKQPSLLIAFIIAGICSGIIFDIGNFIKFLFSNKKFPSIIIDIIQTSFIIFVEFIINLKYNYGQIRLFPIFIFLIFFTIERLTLGKIVAKFYSSCYNNLIKLICKMWRKKQNDKTNEID